MPCGSGMTVAQLRVAVKKKQPNVAVSKLTKPALLAFYEGRKKSAPTIPKMTKAVKAKGATLSKAKKAPPIPAPLKAPPLPAPSARMKASDAKKNRKPDALPAHLTMMIRKMATDSSKKEADDNPVIRLEKMVNKELKWASHTSHDIRNAKPPNSFAQRLIKLTNDVHSLTGKYRPAKPEELGDVIRDYIKLHRMGNAIYKKISTIHDKFEREIHQYRYKHKDKLADYYVTDYAQLTNLRNRLPEYYRIRFAKDQIAHFYTPLIAYLRLDKLSEEYPILRREAFKRGYNHHQGKFNTDLIDKYKVPGKKKLLEFNNYKDVENHSWMKSIGNV
jgi:hypothetical protein